MCPKYLPPSVESILETPEVESRSQSRGRVATATDIVYNSGKQHKHPPRDEMLPVKTHAERHREKHDRPRRSRRESVSSYSRHGQQSTKVKSKLSSSKRTSRSVSRNNSSVTRRNHVFSLPRIGNDTLDFYDEDDGSLEDHRAILAASRGRLTSPSLLSTVTSLTTTTNASSSSSGSNSTITQASMSRHSQLAESKASQDENSLTPAVPDPPDVFSFLVKESPPEDYGAEDEINKSQFLLNDAVLKDQDTMTPQPTPAPDTESVLSSSGSSSFHSDLASDRGGGNETDRSTSPERSVKGEEQDARDRTGTSPLSPMATKVAAQIEAAKHRQDLHGSSQVNGAPPVPTVPPLQFYPPAANVHDPRAYHPMHPRFPPRATSIPITGYEAIASKLSSTADSDSDKIQPIYRKFETLNHRLLLHLQDELAELEEQLHRLDGAETQSRSIRNAYSKPPRILPASRRLSAQNGGNLEYHKNHLLSQISLKLAQYNQVLTSFGTLAQTFPSPNLESIAQYRAYLSANQPIIEPETHFLNATDDLVILSQPPPPPCTVPAPTTKHTPSSPPPAPSAPNPSQQLQTLAVAVAAAVLIPLLTFAVVPGFLGRMAVVLIVAFGVRRMLLATPGWGFEARGSEQVVCVVVYTVAMAVVSCVSA